MSNITNVKGIVWHIHIGVESIGLCFHFIGIFAIMLSNKKSNQRLILFFLSVGEILFVICNLCILFDVVSKACYTLLYIAMFQNVLNMFILTIDRLVCVINPLKYNVRVTMSRIKKVIFITWILSITFGVLKCAFPQFTGYCKFVVFFLYLLYIIVVLVTYSLVGIAIRKSNEQFRPGLCMQEGLKKELVLPSAIIANFILFYLIPVAILSIPVHVKVLYKTLCHLFIGVGLALNPIVYIIFIRQYREVLTNCWKRYRGKTEAREVQADGHLT